MSKTFTADEQLVKEAAFTTNLVLFWLKTDFSLTSKRILGSVPNTLMGIIPLGKREFTYPLKNIAGVAISSKFHFLRFIIGLFLVSYGTRYIIEGGIFVIILGLLALLNSYMTVFSISNSAGQDSKIEISWTEKTNIQQFSELINNKIAEV